MCVYVCTTRYGMEALCQVVRELGNKTNWWMLLRGRKLKCNCQHSSSAMPLQQRPFLRLRALMNVPVDDVGVGECDGDHVQERALSHSLVIIIKNYQIFTELLLHRHRQGIEDAWSELVASEPVAHWTKLYAEASCTDDDPASRALTHVFHVLLHVLHIFWGFLSSTSAHVPDSAYHT